jgi:hypothetical protein
MRHSLRRGWELHDTYADSGHGHGRYAQSTLQLVVQVGPLGGKLLFGFSLTCDERCRFEFASAGHVLGEFFAGDEDDKEYSLAAGNYTFTWTFTTHRSGDVASNDHATIWVRSVQRPLLSTHTLTHSLVCLQFIKVQGTEKGGATKCMQCEEGTYSPSLGSDCLLCPAGSSR